MHVLSHSFQVNHLGQVYTYILLPIQHTNSNHNRLPCKYSEIPVHAHVNIISTAIVNLDTKMITKTIFMKYTLQNSYNAFAFSSLSG